MQRGVIIQHRRSWTLVYYDTQIRNGKRKRVRVSKKLAAISTEYPTKRSVRHLADEVLAPINRKQLQPESSLTLAEFIEDRYFPAITHELRPSTVHNYKVSIYGKHLKNRLGKLRLRDARPVHFQRMLREIRGVSHLTLLHIKNFLSGVFRFARREGVLDGLNPLLDVTVPGRQPKFQGVAYSIDDVDRMLEDIENADPFCDGCDTAYDVITLLSFTGLRQSEARGLRWSDWDEQDQTLRISRSVWQTRVGPTKNPASEATIPVLPLLQNLLKARRERLRPQLSDYIFAGPRRGRPLNFHNLQNRVIKPALDRGKLQRIENGKLVPDEQSGVSWKGFHGFRRGWRPTCSR